MQVPDSVSETEKKQTTDPKPEQAGLQNIALEMEVDHEGNTVFVRGGLVPDSENPPVVFVHDFGETGSLYREATKEFNDRGFSAVSFDMRGHGRSGRRLGHFDRYRTLVQDLLQVAAWLRHRTQGRAPIIVCQGVSTAIGVNFVLRFPKICGRLVLISPVFSMKGGLSKPAAFIVKTLSEFFPHAKVPYSLTPQMLSNIKFGTEEMIHQEKPDVPLAYSTTFVHEVMELMEHLPGRFLRVKSPTLIIRAKSDDVTNFEAMSELLKRHKRRQYIKEIVVEDETHNLLTERSNTLSDTVNVIQAWLAQTTQEEDEQPN